MLEQGPQTCGEIDILTDPLWSMVPYMKGACFYEDVADLICADVLDTILADFYQTHVGHAARMGDMVEAIAMTLSTEQTDAYDALVGDWLTNLECPTDYAERCGARDN